MRSNAVPSGPARSRSGRWPAALPRWETCGPTCTDNRCAIRWTTCDAWVLGERSHIALAYVADTVYNRRLRGPQRAFFARWGGIAGASTGVDPYESGHLKEEMCNDGSEKRSRRK